MPKSNPQKKSVPTFAFVPNPEKASLAKSTVALYKGRLNKIAALSSEEEGKKPVLTAADLLAEPQRVVDLIHAHTDQRQKRAAFFAAIFYAIGRQDLDKNPTALPYVEAFRKNYYTEAYLKQRAAEAAVQPLAQIEPTLQN